MKFIGICNAGIAAAVAVLTILIHDSIGFVMPLSSMRTQCRTLQSSSSSSAHYMASNGGQQWRLQQHPLQGYQPQAPQQLQQEQFQSPPATQPQQQQAQRNLNQSTTQYGQIYSSQYEKPAVAISAVKPGKWNGETYQSGEQVPKQQVLSAQYEKPVVAQSAVRPGKWKDGEVDQQQQQPSSLPAQYYEKPAVAPSSDKLGKWNRPTGPTLQSDQDTSIPAVENYYERQRNGYHGSYYNGGHGS